MMNKKGLSEIVTTLIVILLVLVAIGIIWVVVSNFLKTGTGQIDISSKCLGIDISPSNLTGCPVASGGCTAILERTSSGAPGAVNVMVYATDGATTVNSSTTISPLETKSWKQVNTLTGKATKLSAVPFFYDESGKPVFCSTIQEYALS